MTLVELLGDELSVALDQAHVHVGAAMQAALRARRARTPLDAARAWSRVAVQLRIAGSYVAACEDIAHRRSRAAVLEQPQVEAGKRAHPAARASARAPAPPPSAAAAGALRPGGAARTGRRRRS